MSITIQKLTEHIGAEIRGLDLSKEISPAVAQTLSNALSENYVLLCRGMEISPEEQVRFSKVFGTVQSLQGYGGSKIDGATQGLPPEVLPITNDPGNPSSVSFKATTRWHTDLTWTKAPNKAAVLLARNLPSVGAGTQFSALYPAYNALSEKKKEAVSKLRAIHSIEAGMRREYKNPPEDALAKWRMAAPVEHPVVWSHTDGRKSLLLGPTVDHIVGMSKPSSDELVEELESWCTQQKFIYSHKWQAGDMLIWFNTATMHQAVEYTGPELRLLHRTTVLADEHIQ